MSIEEVRIDHEVEHYDIHKAAGIIIRNRKLLVERSKGKNFFISPGGSVEKGETVEGALIRELNEEFDIEVDENNLEFFDTFFADAAGQEHKRLRMDVFIVKEYRGEPMPNSEVEEVGWVTSSPLSGIRMGSVFEKEVIPRLKQQDLID